MVNEKNLDEVLKRVMPEVNKQLVTDWENDVDYDYKFSWKFKQKMKKLSKYEEKKNIPRKERIRTSIIKFTVEAAACIFALILLSSAFGVDVVAFTHYFTSKIFETKEGGLVHEYHSLVDNSESDEIILEEPGFIPEGYEEVNRDVYFSGINIIYENNQEKQIIWEQYVGATGLTLSIDNEFNRYEKIPYEETDMEIYLYEEKHRVSIYCEKGQYVYMITATDCDKDILMKILKSKKIIEK